MVELVDGVDAVAGGWRRRCSAQCRDAPGAREGAALDRLRAPCSRGCPPARCRSTSCGRRTGRATSRASSSALHCVERQMPGPGIGRRAMSTGDDTAQSPELLPGDRPEDHHDQDGFMDLRARRPADRSRPHGEDQGEDVVESRRHRRHGRPRVAHHDGREERRERATPRSDTHATATRSSSSRRTPRTSATPRGTSTSRRTPR